MPITFVLNKHFSRQILWLEYRDKISRWMVVLCSKAICLVLFFHRFSWTPVYRKYTNSYAAYIRKHSVLLCCYDPTYTEGGWVYIFLWNVWMASMFIVLISCKWSMEI